MEEDANALLSAATVKYHKYGKSGDFRRYVLHRNLARKIHSYRMRRRRQQDPPACRSPARNGRPRCTESQDSADRPAQPQSSLPADVQRRLQCARQFIAGLEPSRVDMQAIEEELGPDPDIEFLDD
ncbi:hypothetical protein HPB50_025698 [Hyalomma asiaticum]|uniref:Uncharacterized protein n=2 Tax=Hyalomma asiaticum TaxID=266040 RepID=A0ACB7SNA9_HYAAI|nr:hypothetical protein HPB50_025696 [Hyalomma asiaticum]KAH6934612.1 hypothetical protein HPB50_025698 [Hyalomma asiaticum]